ncbi:hypothetical protein [Winogradskyella jejuensis]|uniref:Lipoprotein n=1 Tax=Winogradskyella jejuensis TaxID=1089305 RepID=A0A1M5RM01_9FLAO|nr:hypothetical protein [Winogradskyella jejuensis]SHH27169.1 hypothetical protein SAMN05444148_1623 [Winogradskyella jejuensis]
MKSNLFKYLIILFIVISCKKEKWNSVNIHSTSNDSVTKSTKVYYENKYLIYGAKKRRETILDSMTFKQAPGKFTLGIIENNNPLNKLIVFYDTDTLKIAKLNNNNLYKYCLLNEIKSMRKDSTILKCSIDDYYEDIFGEYYEKYINYSFTTNNSDTIAFQKSIYSKVNGKLVTFHFLTETEEKFFELQEMFEEFANQVEN